MSKLAKLLEGVEVKWKALGEISQIYGGLIGKGKADFVSGNSSYISYKNIYDNIEVNLSKLERVKIVDSENQNEVKYGDVLFTGSSETADEAGISSVVTTKFIGSVYLNSFSFGLRFNDDIEILPEFSKYLFRSHFMRLEISKTASGVTRYNISKARFKKIHIPIPPISAQIEIVRILDTFTKRTETLMNELTTELEARKKQYNYFREKLFSFEEGEVEWKTLGEVCRFINGRAYKQPELLAAGKYLVLRVGNFFTNDNWYYSDLELDEDKYCDYGDLLYAWSASFGPKIWKGSKVIYHYHIWKVVPNYNFISKEFLFYLLLWDTTVLKTSHSTGSTMMHISKGSIEKRIVPIPTLAEQAHIVSILDKLESLTASITESLSKEIELRKKQYEYYRDLLLTFPNDNVKA
jgi:type I restriction enzyme S subunit